MLRILSISTLKPGAKVLKINNFLHHFFLSLVVIVSTFYESKRIKFVSNIYTSGHRVVIIGDILYVIGGFNPSHEPPIFSSIRRFHLVERKWLPDAKVTGKASPTMASHCATDYGRFILVHGGSKLPFGTCHKRALYAYDTVESSCYARRVAAGMPDMTVPTH